MNWAVFVGAALGSLMAAVGVPLYQGTRRWIEKQNCEHEDVRMAPMPYHSETLWLNGEEIYDVMIVCRGCYQKLEIDGRRMFIG